VLANCSVFPKTCSVRPKNLVREFGTINRESFQPFKRRSNADAQLRTQRLPRRSVQSRDEPRAFHCCCSSARARMAGSSQGSVASLARTALPAPRSSSTKSKPSSIHAGEFSPLRSGRARLRGLDAVDFRGVDEDAVYQEPLTVEPRLPPLSVTVAREVTGTKAYKARGKSGTAVRAHALERSGDAPCYDAAAVQSVDARLWKIPERHAIPS
jgi:hypothetical protein